MIAAGLPLPPNRACAAERMSAAAAGNPLSTNVHPPSRAARNPLTQRRPAAVTGSRRTDEHHVDDGDLPISNIGCDLPCLVVASPVSLRIVCRGGFREGDLSHMRTLPRCK